jgi:hypothetical protein
MPHSVFNEQTYYNGFIPYKLKLFSTGSWFSKCLPGRVRSARHQSICTAGYLPNHHFVLRSVGLAQNPALQSNSPWHPKPGSLPEPGQLPRVVSNPLEPQKRSDHPACLCSTSLSYMRPLRSAAVKGPGSAINSRAFGTESHTFQSSTPRTRPLAR